MNSEKSKTTPKVPHTDILHEIEEHLATGFTKLKEALGDKKIKNRFKKVVKILGKGFGDDKPKKKKAPAKPKVAKAAKVIKKTAKKVVKKEVKAVKETAKKVAKKAAPAPAKKVAVKKTAVKKSETATEE